MEDVSKFMVQAVLSYPSKEMFEFYTKRTGDHIARVRNNIKTILTHFSDLDEKELLKRGKDHDASKYSEKEFIPYVWLTEFHRCQNDNIPFEYPAGIEEQVEPASEHHINNNRHHPESFNDPNEMTLIDVIEMVADWNAMSQELGTSLKDWVKTTLHKDKKWVFDKKHLNWINNLVSIFEK